MRLFIQVQRRSVYLAFAAILLGLSLMAFDLRTLTDLPTVNGAIRLKRDTPKAGRPRINYKLHPENFYEGRFHPFYRCDPTKRRALDATLAEVLNFTTTFSTDLNILVMGDSVGIQLAQGLQEAAGAQLDDSRRQVLRYTARLHEGLFVAPTQGDGVVTGWRMTNMWQRSRENKPLPNHPAGGWVREDAQKVLNYTYEVSRSNESQTATPMRRVGSFDVVIFRIPHGWITPDEITAPRLNEMVELAKEHFNVSSVIFQGITLNNNVEDYDHYNQVSKKNALIQVFVQAYQKQTASNATIEVSGHVLPKVSDVRVVFLDFGSLASKFVYRNARLLGFEASDLDQNMSEVFLNYRLQKKRHDLPTTPITMACGERVPHGSQNCPLNQVSLDGLHWCSETLNGRMHGGIACLLACLYNPGQAPLPICEADCNQKFMSLRIIEELVG